jgi:DNA-binding protein HU-beta
MTKQELVIEVAKQVALPKSKALAVIDALFAPNGIISTELKKGRRVLITGFGHFETRTRAARNGRHPRTGGSIAINSSTAPVFRPGKPLRDSLNKRR